MKKFISTISILTLFIITGCQFKNPDANQAQGTETPSTNGPTAGPDSMKAPDSPPNQVTTEGSNKDIIEIQRTHQTLEIIYGNEADPKKARLTFNIDEDQVKGIMIEPSFKDPKELEGFSKLTKQVIDKDITDLTVTQVEELPEFSPAFAKALERAVNMYIEKNK